MLICAEVRDEAIHGTSYDTVRRSATQRDATRMTPTLIIFSSTLT